MEELNTALLAIGLMIIVIGSFSRPMQQSPFSPPMLALCVGIALGPVGLGVLHPDRWADTRLLEQAARLTLAIGLMGVALRLPDGFVRRHKRPLLMLLGVVMPMMWLSVAGLAWFLFPVPLFLALVLGAVVCPTDPIVASAIVTGDLAEAKVPEPTRHIITAESGANDGLAYPFVMLSIALFSGAEPHPWQQWLVQVVLWQTGGAVVLGAVMGWIGGWLFRSAETRHSIAHSFYLAFCVALALVALGGARLLGTDGVLAVFVTGLCLNRMIGNKDKFQEEQAIEGFNRFFTLPIFALFGLMLPWQQWLAEGWRLCLMALLVMLLRRLPFVLALRRWIFPQPQGAWFAGWFGPIGVAALFYSTLALRETGAQSIWVVGSFLVFVSLIVHGLSAATFTRHFDRLGAWGSLSAMRANRPTRPKR